MYKGTPDKNPGASLKNDEKMKSPGPGNGPAQMQKPGEQSGQRESGPVSPGNQGPANNQGNENPGQMNREVPGQGPQSQGFPGSESPDTAGHGGPAPGNDQMSQGPAGQKHGQSGCNCPCMQNSDRQQDPANGPSGKSGHMSSDKGPKAPEGSMSGPREASGPAPGNVQMSKGPVGQKDDQNGGGCPGMQNSDRQQGPSNGPSGKADHPFSDKGPKAPEESANGPRGGAIGPDQTHQGGSGDRGCTREKITRIPIRSITGPTSINMRRLDAVVSAGKSNRGISCPVIH